MNDGVEWIGGRWNGGIRWEQCFIGDGVIGLLISCLMVNVATEWSEYLLISCLMVNVATEWSEYSLHGGQIRVVGRYFWRGSIDGKS